MPFTKEAFTTFTAKNAEALVNVVLPFTKEAFTTEIESAYLAKVEAVVLPFTKEAFTTRCICMVVDLYHVVLPFTKEAFTTPQWRNPGSVY